MKNKVINTLDKFNMINKSIKVIAAISGGADSIAMTHCLWSLRSKYNFNLLACHINHTLRDNESERDYRFTVDFCKRYNIPLVIFREDIRLLSKLNSKSIELTARERRYLRFQQCVSSEYDKIATAHTLNDRAETLIHNIMRGTSMKGVVSIPFIRDNIIRPIIECTRDEIEKYCKDNNLKYVTDSSNLSNDYTRNKIRHDIIPNMCKIYPSSISNMKKLMDSAYDDNIFLEEYALNLTKQNEDKSYDVDVIKRQPLAIKKRIIRNILCEYNFEVNNERIQEICKSIEKNSFKIEYSKDRYICYDNKKIYVLNKEKVIDNFYFEIDINKTYQVLSKKINFKLMTYEEFKNLRNNNKIDLKNFIDYDTISNKVFLRKRMNGDKIKLKGRNATKTLKKLFNEKKLTYKQREETVIISNNDKQNIIWIENFGPSEKSGVTNKSRNILFINIMEENQNDK